MRLGLGISIPGTSGLVQAAFSPLDLSPVLWLDASDTSTITESGGAVSQWDDKSGNGNDVTQATASAQPTTGSTTINGLNVLALDGADFMTSASLSFTGLTMCAVFQHSSENFYLLGTGTSNVYAGRGADGSSAAPVDNMGSMTLRFNGAAFSGTTSNDVYDTMAASTKVVTLSVDGSFTQQIRPYGYTSSTGMPVGAIAEVIIVDGTLTAGEIADTETYLANKWGITL